MLINQLKMWLMVMIFYLSLSSWSLASWASIWLVMEILVLFFMGLLSLSYNYDSSSLMMKFYVIQLLVSLLFMVCMLFYLMNFSLDLQGCQIFLIAKLGLFPFHFWIINIMGKMDWSAVFFLSSFLKLPPLSLLYYMMELYSLSLIVIGSIYIGSWGGLNNTNIQKILAYSSVVHLSWLLFSLSVSVQLFWMYFLGYSATLLILVFVFVQSNFYYINQLKFSLVSILHHLMVIFIIVSLAGFPPFLGFVMKWALGGFMGFCNLKFMLFMMISFSVLSVVYYFQLGFYCLLLWSFNGKFYFSETSLKILWIVLMLMLSFYLTMYLII